MCINNCSGHLPRKFVCLCVCLFGRRSLERPWRVRNSLRFLFVCLFVCLFAGIKPEKLYSASCVGREVNLMAVITHRQRHKPRAYQRQRNRPLARTGQSIFCFVCLRVEFFLKTDSGYPKDAEVILFALAKSWSSSL